MLHILRWCAAIVIGVSITTILTLVSLLMSAIGMLIGAISTGGLVIAGISYTVYEWLNNKK